MNRLRAAADEKAGDEIDVVSHQRRDKRGTQPMQRRKLLVGMGSLAAGGAFTMGTGALSKTQIDRGLTGTVATDTPTAYVELRGGVSNGQHAHVDGTGTELVLDFGNISGPAEGLNADSVNWFDNTFKVELLDPDQDEDCVDYDIWITKNPSMNNPSKLDFYLDSTRSNSIVGVANRVALTSNCQRKVGVMIDLDDTGLNKNSDLSDLFGVSNGEDLFTVHLDNNV